MSESLIYDIVKKAKDFRNNTYSLRKENDLLAEMMNKTEWSSKDLNDPKYKTILSTQTKSEKLIAELFALLDELDVIEGRGIQR
jgi:hypothetical protein